MKKIISGLFAIIIILILVGCTASNTNSTSTNTEVAIGPAYEPIPAPTTVGVHTVRVGSYKIDCEGEGPLKCLVINDGIIYGSIEGFDYQPGYNYVLKIEITNVENPPADGSSKKYILLEVISKTLDDNNLAIYYCEGGNNEIIWKLSTCGIDTCKLKFFNEKGKILEETPEIGSGTPTEYTIKTTTKNCKRTTGVLYDQWLRKHD